MIPIRIRPLGLALGALVLAASPAAAQDHGQHGQAGQGQQATKPAGHQGMQHASGWQELDDYHVLMMTAWHPVRQKNDVAPARERAAAMAEAAEKWAASTPPEKCAGDETKANVAKVAADSKAFAELVERNGSDEEVKAAIAALHETFEKVAHACMGEH